MLLNTLCLLPIPFHTGQMLSKNSFHAPSIPASFFPKGVTVETIPEAVLEECAQLVKANSIQGSKSPAVDVVYTAFENLKKTGSMDVGQVGFHDHKKACCRECERQLIVKNG